MLPKVLLLQDCKKNLPKPGMVVHACNKYQHLGNRKKMTSSVRPV
jgi:hypothetical protein